MLAGDERAHLGLGVGAGADFERAHPRHQLIHQPVAGAADRDGDRDRHAALAGRAVGGAHQRIGRLVEVGVGHHHHVVFGAAQGLHAFPTLGGGSVDVMGDWCRADKADRGDIRVMQQGVDRLLVTVDDVEDARRQTGFGQQFGDAEAGGGVALRRLQHKGVAAGERHREHPHRHHRREVERRDPGADAERLAQRPAVDAAPDLLGELAFEEMRDAAGEFDDLGAARHLAGGVGEDLAVLIGDQASESAGFAVEQFAKFEQNPGAGQRRRRRPGRKSRRRSSHRLVHLAGAGEGNATALFAGRRVVNVAPAPTSPLGALAFDVMVDVAHPATRWLVCRRLYHRPAAPVFHAGFPRAWAPRKIARVALSPSALAQGCSGKVLNGHEQDLCRVRHNPNSSCPALCRASTPFERFGRGRGCPRI